MSSTKCVIYKYIAERSKLFGECIAVLGLFCSVTGVLKKDNVAVFHGLYGCFCVRSDSFRICCEFYFPSKKLGKSYCYRCE